MNTLIQNARQLSPFRFLVAAGITALMLAGATSAAWAQEIVAGAHGQGNVTFDGELRTFSFTVVEFDDGTAVGQAQLKNRAQGDLIHIEIDCLFIDETGTTATMSGVVTQAEGPTFAVGDAVFFAVQDNGEGADAVRDQISLVFNAGPGPIPGLCDLLGAPPPEFLMPIDAGNIQVRP